jgi:CheY-like chemotaxis protein
MKTIHILLVEDNDGDILLTTEALEDSKIINKVSVVKDGKEALNFLKRADGYENKELPDLVLLDVNLPKKNGHEVLHFIKGNAELRHIPVIMLTTSSSQTDIDKAYNNYVNCYITKPVDAGEFIEAVTKIESFWISIVRLPSK